MQDGLAAVGEIYMVKFNVLPLRRQVFAIDVHRFYVQNGVGLVYADINGAERAEKLPAESSCSKRMKEQMSIKRQFVSSMVPPK